MARKRVAGPVAEVKEVEKVSEKATYKALIDFRDKNGFVIKKGDEYEADEEYIEYLLGSKNKTGAAVIEKK